MTDYAALAERLDEHAQIHEDERANWYGADAEQIQWSQDLRTAAQLARERAEAPEPVAWRFKAKVWLGEDHFEEQWRVSPTFRDGAEPLYAAPQPAAQPQSEPISDSDADHWLRHRAAILDAIRKAGFVLMSNASGFWLHPAGESKAQSAPATVKESLPVEPTCKQALQVEPTEAQIERAARRMCQRKADMIGLSFDLLWPQTKIGFMEEAAEVLRAALAAKE